MTNIGTLSHILAWAELMSVLTSPRHRGLGYIEGSAHCGPLFDAPFDLYGQGELRTTYICTDTKTAKGVSPIDKGLVGLQWRALVLGHASEEEQMEPGRTHL